MDFIFVCELFERLEKKSKRLEKIMLLRDFLIENKSNAPLIFDFIAGNFQREIDKRSLGISLKTVFSVLGFVSKIREAEIEKVFNKKGDIGEVAKEVLQGTNKQTGFSSKKLLFEDIIEIFKTISSISGVNKNKIKKELISKLFLYADTDIEYKFLARIFIDDLRIGVSEGVLKEVCVNAYFPSILGVNNFCSCSYSNLNVVKCFKCQKEIDMKNQEEIVSKNYKIVEIGPPKEEIGLENFVGKYNNTDILRFILRLNRKEHVLKSQNPREIYNIFTKVFEKKYNVMSSFSKVLKEMDYDIYSVLQCNIELGTPIRSMLGTRANNIEASFDITGMPALLDFKYDGLRVQIHNYKGDVRLFSRNLDDITRQFPEVVDFINKNFLEVPFVMDSECVGFDFNDGRFLPFQVLSKRILTKKVSDVNHIKIVVKAFDILYYKEKTLIDEPYERRREILESLFVGRSLRQTLSFDIKKLIKIV